MKSKGVCWQLLRQSPMVGVEYRQLLVSRACAVKRFIVDLKTLKLEKVRNG